MGPTATWDKLNNELIEHKLEYKGCEWLSKFTGMLKSPKIREITSINRLKVSTKIIKNSTCKTWRTVLNKINISEV